MYASQLSRGTILLPRGGGAGTAYLCVRLQHLRTAGLLWWWWWRRHRVVRLQSRIPDDSRRAREQRPNNNGTHTRSPTRTAESVPSFEGFVRTVIPLLQSQAPCAGYGYQWLCGHVRVHAKFQFLTIAFLFPIDFCCCCCLSCLIPTPMHVAVMAFLSLVYLLYILALLDSALYHLSCTLLTTYFCLRCIRLHFCRR